LNENNIEVSDLVYAPIASSLAVLDKNQREYGVVNLDFGGETSSVTIYEEGEMAHSNVLPIGSNHITKDLAVFLRTQMDIAEKIKIEHCMTSQVHDLRRRVEVDLSPLTGEDNHKIQKNQLIRVVDARVHELFDFVNEEIKRAPKRGILPAGVVLCGGGANLPGFLQLARDKMRLPVKIAKPVHFDGISEIVDDPSYSVSLGLVLWGIDQELQGIKPAKQMNFSVGNPDLPKKILNWFKSFLP
jgi:cell division protein FtsA